MVQDKERLNEVGLSPDKPQGHIRGIWAITLIVAFALIIGGGIYFILWYSPWNNDANMNTANKADETADWQTYSNSTYNFAIKYPKDWEHKESNFVPKDINMVDEHSYFIIDFYNPSNKENELISINIFKGDQVAVYTQETTGASPRCKDLEDVKIAGQDGKSLKCFDVGDLNLYYEEYLVTNGGYTYFITTKEENKVTLDKMIGTLSFGSASASPTPSTSANYSTYTERTRGSFSFEYPRSWKILKSNPYDADAEKMELLYENSGVLNTSLVIVEDHKNETGLTDVRQVAKDMLPQDGFVTDTTLGGKSTIKVSGDEGMPPRIRYFSINNGYLIIVIGENFEGNNNLTATQQNNKAAFDHIVSSWKWL